MPFRHGKSLAKSQRRAIPVPETELRMNEDAERRRSQSFNLRNPALKRPPGLFKRVKRLTSELMGDRFDHIPCPAIERVWSWRPPEIIAEARPQRRPRMTDQKKSSGDIAIIKLRKRFGGDEPAAQHQPDISQPAIQFAVDIADQGSVFPSGVVRQTSL
ncbi:MAG: hypothetical protein MnENMB40S_23970 [Rhizobiaceae bacterium MnEN-MB40S]|nr:MAG: hypothetical protein MnENMB40S_23970 [Rhizobiaceae bacterium MnEN-MB40S]